MQVASLQKLPGFLPGYLSGHLIEPLLELLQAVAQDRLFEQFLEDVPRISFSFIGAMKSKTFRAAR